MKITFLTPSDNLSGGNRVVAIYAKALQALGHEILVVSNAPDRLSLREKLHQLRTRGLRGLTELWSSPPQQPGHIAQAGVPHHILQAPRPIAASDVPDADIVIATWWETADWVHSFPAAKGHKVHLIQGYEAWFDPATNQRVHDTLRLPNLKIAISEGLRRDIEVDLGSLNIHVVPNAVDGTHFDAPPRHKQAKPCVGFIYGTPHGKAADRYYAAIAQARREIPELQVVAFGGEAPHPDLPLPPGARYIQNPPQAEIPGLYAQCDAWLFASRIDSFGLPILEAMACRTPVIGVAVGAAPDLLNDGCGWLLDPSPATEEALIQAMAKAIVDVCRKNENTWAACATKAHTRAHAYTWETATKRLLQLLTASAH